MTAREMPPGVAVVLQHDNGTDVFLVGVGHVSPTSVHDVSSAIEALKPGAVLLELDRDHYDRLMKWDASGDKYGISSLNTGYFFQDVLTVVKDQIIQSFLGLYLVILGAVCGSPPGHEFVAAGAAATKVRAAVVLGDRRQSVTEKRLQAAISKNSFWPIFVPFSDPYLGPHKVFVGGIAKMAEAGDYTSGKAAVAAIERLLQVGWEGKPIEADHLLATRACVLPIVEHARQQELQECTLAEAEGSGMESSIDAWEETITSERDLILARRLWETAERTRGRPVVGVVGVGHIKGITQAWPTIGSGEVETMVQDFMKDPPACNRGGQVVTAILAAGVAGCVAYQRPRAALLVVGAGTVVMTSHIIFKSYVLNRFRKLAKKMVRAAEELDQRGPP